MKSEPPHFWNTAAVRHLAWLCQAPQLITGPLVRPLAATIPADLARILTALDQSPEPLLSCLNCNKSPRLGQYFESLYEFFLTHILGWEVLLRNVAIRDGTGRTLGELDFVVRDPETGAIQHHEVAIKFYLGLEENGATLWYGPNAQDRLDLKAQRMKNHQATMTQRPETLAAMASHGLGSDIEPVIVMPGNLFYPVTPGPLVQTPPWVNRGHERGSWIRQGLLETGHIQDWTVLKKPHWLGPYQSCSPPDPELTSHTLTTMAEAGRPGLFAKMVAREDGRGFDEISRCFVVPDHWPGQR